MKKIAATLGSLFALWAALSFFPTVAQTPQFPQTLNANTVVGRLGIGPGPAQQIPIPTLTNNLLQAIGGDFACTINPNTCTINPGVVTNAKLANMAATTVKCNSTGSAGVPQDCALIVSNNTALQALATTVPTGGLVFRAAFSSAGDGGQAYYAASGSACALNAGAGDNGWQVKSADNKCWIASFPATGADVRAWGAVVGSNVDTALNAAINFACSTRIPIFLPYPATTSFYLLNSEIDFGNGTAAVNSTCNGITFSVTQQNDEEASGVGILAAFKWNGAGGIIPFVVKGPALSINLKGVSIDCAATCATGFKINNPIDGIFEDLGVWNNTGGPAFYITSIPNNVWPSGNEFNRYRNLKAIFPGTNASGVQIGETTTSGSNLAVINNTFIDIAVNWDGTCATCYGIQLGLANINTFINTTVAPSGGAMGNSLKIAPVTGLTTFPTDNLFIHPFFQAVANDPGGTWTGTVGQTFIDWSTAGAAFPTSTVQILYSGTDSKGFSYPRGTWTPTDTSGATLTFTTTDTVYVINNKICTVSFNITYPTTANGSNAQIGGLPCTPQSTTNPIFGGVPSFTTQGSQFSILLTTGTPNMQFYTNAGAQLTNTNFSTKTVRASLTFPIQ